jgi:hypothetical protein
MPDCVDHGWECTGLGHEKVIDLKDLFKETEMPIPFDPTCALFLAALAEIQAANQLSLLDVRLGLEQLLDDPDFRAELTTRWNDEDPASFPLGPDESFELFRSVSDRHAELSGPPGQGGAGVDRRHARVPHGGAGPLGALRREPLAPGRSGPGGRGCRVGPSSRRQQRGSVTGPRTTRAC